MYIALSVLTANDALTAVLARIDGGGAAASMEFYTGAKPANPETAVTTQVLLGTAVLSYPCGSVADKILTFGAITQDGSADATGVATWVRIKNSAGVAIIDLDVSVVGGGGAVEMNTTTVVILGPISVASAELTV